MEDGNKLGCKVWELGTGDEFSIDQGCSWLRCLRVPEYINPEPDALTMSVTVVPFGDAHTENLEQLEMLDTDHVLLRQPGEGEKKRRSA